MTTQQSAINWFEIPVIDIRRAKNFYETILQIKMESQEMNGAKMAFFPYDQVSGVGGALIQDAKETPSQTGTVVYLNGGEDLQLVLDRVEGVQGKIAMPKTRISEDVGYMGIFIDTEGNRVALHSFK